MRAALPGGALCAALPLVLLAALCCGRADTLAVSAATAEQAKVSTRRFGQPRHSTGAKATDVVEEKRRHPDLELRQVPAGSRLVPLENDTIPLQYWRAVDAAITLAGLSTSKAPSLNDPASTPAPEPWRRVFQARQEVKILDTPEEERRIDSWQFATPRPPFGADLSAKSSQVREMSVVPYDMQLGARVMYGLSEKNTETPPPTQEYVDQALVAQCPMVMFKDAVSIRAPRCGMGMGSWVDPATDRPLMRWKQNELGGLHFGVDSLVTGQGSVEFAELNERLSLNKYVFELSNCKSSTYYTVEESIVKVNSIAPRAFSTVFQHDVAESREAYFYKYTIKRPNGTGIAETMLFRMDQDQVNFTSITDDLTSGTVVAVASRLGHWRRAQWRECTDDTRGWGLTFPQHSQSYDTVATVEDLRVAATAVITLMAFRDEDVGKDGFQHVGQGRLYWDLVRTFFAFLFSSVLFCIVWIVFRKKGWEKRLRRLCFRAEAIFLPKRPVATRPPIMQPAW